MHRGRQGESLCRINKMNERSLNGSKEVTAYIAVVTACILPSILSLHDPNHIRPVFHNPRRLHISRISHNQRKIPRMPKKPFALPPGPESSGSQKVTPKYSAAQWGTWL